MAAMTKITIATRSSKLAIAQAEMIRHALMTADPALSADDVILLPMTTSGDRQLDKDISQWGYKGLFTKEIDEALLDGRAQIAMHSMKDVPSELPGDIIIGGMLPRDDARDAFVSTRYGSLEDMPPGRTLGTSSVRRAAMISHHRPDLTIIPFRGNVNSRVQKLEDGVADATLLAVAGLKRLQMEMHITQILSIDRFLPAIAQGAIGMQCLKQDDEIRERLAAISHPDTVTCVTAERALLATLDGSCKTPIAGHATLDGDTLTLTGCVFAPDGSGMESISDHAPAGDAEALGNRVGNTLLDRVPDAWLKEQ